MPRLRVPREHRYVLEAGYALAFAVAFGALYLFGPDNGRPKWVLLLGMAICVALSVRALWVGRRRGRKSS